jgi:hypothetical protein
MSHAKWTTRYYVHHEKVSAIVLVSEQTNDIFISTLIWHDNTFSIEYASFAAKTASEAFHEALDFLTSKYGKPVSVEEVK